MSTGLDVARAEAPSPFIFLPENFASCRSSTRPPPESARWHYVLSFYAYATMRRKWTNWGDLQNGFGR